MAACAELSPECKTSKSAGFAGFSPPMSTPFSKRLTITEGRFHQVKRMFEAVGKKVTYLKRVEMGSLVLPDELAPGEYRPLTEEELQELRRH